MATISLQELVWKCSVENMFYDSTLNVHISLLKCQNSNHYEISLFCYKRRMDTLFQYCI